MNQKTISLFWAKVNKNVPNEKLNCWNWIGSKIRGYGQFRFGKKMFKAHRFSYLIHFGKLNNSLHVCHKCDNPSCVNPEHLFEGTAKQNVEDAWKKGRAKTIYKNGDKHPNAKLASGDVLFCRSTYVPRKNSYNKLAKRFGVKSDTVRSAVIGINWKTI